MLTAIYNILTNVFYIGKYRYNVHQQDSGHKAECESEWITIGRATAIEFKNGMTHTFSCK